MTLEAVKKTFFIAFIFIAGNLLHATEDDTTPYIKYAKEIMNPFIEECEKKYHLDCIGTGGRFANNVGEIEISFIAYRKGSIEEARTLEVNLIEKILAQINAHEKIRPFLNNYPFESKNIDISVAFRKEDNSCYTDGSVVLVFLARNKLFYKTEDPKTENRIDLYDEPYIDALKIVNSKSSEAKKI